MRGLNKIMETVLEFDKMFDMGDFAWHLAHTADYATDKGLPAYETREKFLKIITPHLTTANHVGALSRRIKEIIDESFRGTLIILEGTYIDTYLSKKPNNAHNKNFRFGFDN